MRAKLTNLFFLASLLLLGLPQNSFGIVGLGSGKLKDPDDQGCHKTAGGLGAPMFATTGQGNETQCATCPRNGMPSWSVSSPYCNVWLSDQPISYTLSSGKTMAFRWLYEQREHPAGDLGLREWDVGAQQVPIRLRGNSFGVPPAMFAMTNGAWCHNWWSEIVFWDTTFETSDSAANQSPTPLPPSAPTNGVWSFSSAFEGVVFFGEGGSMYFNTSSLNAPLGSGKAQVQILGQTSTNGGPEVPVDKFLTGSGYVYSYPVITNGVAWVTNPQYGFKLLYPDGSQDVYGFVRVVGSKTECIYGSTDPRCQPSQGTNKFNYDYTSRAYLTERIDPQGRSTHLIYTKQAQTNQFQVVTLFYPMTYVVDPDGRTNTYYYNPNDHTQLQYIVDVYGRTNSLTYNSQGMLSSLKDGAGLSSSFQYQPAITTVTTNYTTNGIVYQVTTSYAGWLTNLSTPYGNTRFDYFDETTNSSYGVTRRAVLVTETNNTQQFYAYIHNAGTLLTNSARAAEIPTVPFGGYTFDTGNVSDAGGGLNLRNSLYWDQRQFPALSTSVTNALAITLFHPQPDLPTAMNSLSANDLQKGRLEHWLVDSDGITTTEYLSSEREPSFDSGGQTNGARTWFDYAGKQSGAPFQVGTQVLIGCSAQVLPDGSSQFIGLDYATSGFPTNRWESYTTAAGTNSVRTNAYVYAANGVDPVSVAWPAGESVQLVYNAAHQVNFITNALSQVTTLNWDANTFNLDRVALPSGQVIGINYYPTNSPGSAPTSTGALVSNVMFEAQGLVVAVADYTNGLPRVVHVSGTGLTDLWFTNTWDGLNRLTSTAFTDGTTISNIFSRLDLVGQKDRRGYWTYFGYDAFRHPTSITDALSNVTSFSWCNCGALTSITDPLSNLTILNYNNQGLLTSIVFADYSSLTYSYDSISRLTNVADGLGSLAAAYNNQGALTSISNAYGAILGVVYDALDRPVRVTDANGLTITNTFDLLDRLLTRSWPGGGVEGILWSTNGLLAYTNQNQRVTWYGRDAAGRLVGLTNANQEITALAYNAFGQVTNLWDGRTNQTSWHFNQFGWLTNKVDALGREVMRLTYNPNGQVTNRWTPQSSNTTYAYDPVGNLTSITYPGSTTPSVAYVYDAVSRLKAVVDSLGTHTFSYTPIGQPQTEVGSWASDGVTNIYTHQLRQNLNLAQPSGGFWAQTYGYDSAWRLQTLTSPAGAFGYGYSIGQSASPASLVHTISLPNAAWITNHFDSLDRLDYTALVNAWGHVLDGYAYAHDALGLRTNITRLLGMTTNNVAVGYDRAGQVISWAATESNGVPRLNEQYGFGFDQAGNLHSRTNGALIQTFTCDPANKLTNVTRTGNLTLSGATAAPVTNLTVNGLAALTYGDLTFAATSLSLNNGANSFTNIARNAFGTNSTNIVAVNLPTPVALQFDGNGSLTNDGTRSFVYDAESRLVTNSVAGAWKAEFVYDGLGRRRVERDYGWQSGSSSWGNPTNELHFIYDGWLLIQIRDGYNNVLVTYTRGLDLSGSIAGAGGIGGLLARTANGTNSFYHADGSGNITALIDNYQIMQARYEYSPFGRLVEKWGASADANEMQFSSMPVHRLSGMSMFVFRDGYDPTIQRWIQQDPIGEAGGINLYQFADNSPLNVIDPFGFDGLWMSPDGKVHTDTPPSERQPEPEDFQQELDAQIQALGGRSVGPLAGGIGQVGGTVVSLTPQETFSEVVLGETLQGEKVGTAQRIGQGALAAAGPALTVIGREGKLLNKLRKCPVKTPWGWNNGKKYRDALKALREAGMAPGRTLQDVLGHVPSKDEALKLLEDAGVDMTKIRIEDAHLPPNPHTFPHINFVTPSGAKATVQIQGL